MMIVLILHGKHFLWRESLVLYSGFKEIKAFFCGPWTLCLLCPVGRCVWALRGQILAWPPPGLLLKQAGGEGPIWKTLAQIHRSNLIRCLSALGRIRTYHSKHGMSKSFSCPQLSLKHHSYQEVSSPASAWTSLGTGSSLLSSPFFRSSSVGDHGTQQTSGSITICPLIL